MKQGLLKHIILGLLFALIALSSFGQTEPMFTQYMNNPQLINPAYAGIEGSFNVNGIFRDQWSNWKGSDGIGTPKTTSISVNGPFRIYQVGLGLDFMHDQVGALSQTRLFANYAYHLPLNNSTFSFGIKTGFEYIQKDLTGLSTYEPDNWVNSHLVTTKPMFNVGIGMYYLTDKFFAGLSVPKLIRNSWTEAGDDTNEILGKSELHAYLTAGYVFTINNDLKFKPTAMLRMVQGSPVSAEITGTAIFVDRIWLGLMYRVGDALAAHTRFEVRDGLQLGYSYDLTRSELVDYNSGTHEIFISYTIKKKKKRIVSPRFF